MDSGTIKTLKTISCIFGNITLFVSMFMFGFDRIYSGVEALDNLGDAGFFNMFFGLLMVLAVMVPSIFSFFGDVIAMIVILINNKLDTKGLRTKIKVQIIIETIQFGLAMIMALLSGIVVFLIIAMVEISIQLINIYVWNNVKMY